ncbi:GNAT family N-acetyltransferase [Erwiniaceae bacterium L1_55_4]|nr:GNAT family N-acetyltransferase [Erwiniaceae bacterium L1_55_4]
MLEKLPLITDRLELHLLSETNLSEFHLFINRNKHFFAPYEPLRDESYYDIECTKDRIKSSYTDFNSKKCLLLIIKLKNSNEVIGSINFTNFIYGVFQACYLGFSLDESFQGKGLMYEALEKCLPFVKQNYDIHRIMANHLLDNFRSEKTLSSLGFLKEGVAKSYLKINGKWQDHALNSYIFSE